MDKTEWRQRLLQTRASISDRARKDKHIEQAALRLAEKYNSVFIYVSMGSEVNTHGIIRALLTQKKQVLVPHTLPDKIMHACCLLQDDLTCDKLGNIRDIGAVCDGQAPLIFVPLLGFNQSCYRLGYGAGCYDRYFTNYPQGYKVGLAYNEQSCTFTPTPDDVPLDCIITPDKCIRREV